MVETYRPSSGAEVEALIAWAVAEEAALEVAGAGSKRGLGRPSQLAHVLELSGLSGITLYEPAELVLSAKAGTPLAEIQAALAEHNQALAFEPPDLAPLYGGEFGAGTLGGLVACNLSGPRRIKAGAARDHLLGFVGVTGRGETIKSGGRVVKNVTGYDLSKLMAGSFGTLAALTEITVKVLPAAEKTRSVLLYGLDDAAAVQAMSQALGTPLEVSGAAHLPAALTARSAVSHVAKGGGAVTILRLEGPGPSVAFRCEALRRQFATIGDSEELHSLNSQTLWNEIASARLLGEDAAAALWRVSVAPSAGPALVQALAPLGGRHYFDWGGGLVWLALPIAAEQGDGGARSLRDVVAGLGGHATLLRAREALRREVPVFQPQAAGLAALTRRIKDSFDPKRVLNPGRMYPEV